MKNLIQLVQLVLSYNKKENRTALVHFEIYEWGVEFKVFMEGSLDYVIDIQSGFDNKSIKTIIDYAEKLIEDDKEFINKLCPITPNRKSKVQRKHFSLDLCDYSK